jgi:hypothetical protein
MTAQNQIEPKEKETQEEGHPVGERGGEEGHFRPKMGGNGISLPDGGG